MARYVTMCFAISAENPWRRFLRSSVRGLIVFVINRQVLTYGILGDLASFPVSSENILDPSSYTVLLMPCRPCRFWSYTKRMACRVLV
jgi:hypothetical protein